MGSSANRCSRARSSSRTRCPTCLPGCTSPWWILRSVERAVRLRCAGPTGSSSDPTTVCCSSPRTRSWAASRRPSSSANEGVSGWGRSRRTFHGRDIFAPAAAHLAAGMALGELGPALDPASLGRLELPAPEVGKAGSALTVLYVDKYGNVQVNATIERPGPGRHRARLARSRSTSGYESYFASVARRSRTSGRGEILLYEDSYRNIALAINARQRAPRCSSARSGARAADPAAMREAARRAREALCAGRDARGRRASSGSGGLFRGPLDRRQFDWLAPRWERRTWGLASVAILTAALDRFEVCAAPGPGPGDRHGRRRPVSSRSAIPTAEVDGGDLLPRR